MKIRLIAVLALMTFVTGCASQAVFISEPPGAEVYVNGSRIGNTPCEYKYNLSSGDSYQVTVEKDGFETLHHTVVADEVDKGTRNMLLTAGAIIPGGSVLWLGALFTKGLKNTYEFTLKEEGPRITALAEDSGRDRPY